MKQSSLRSSAGLDQLSLELASRLSSLDAQTPIGGRGTHPVSMVQMERTSSTMSSKEAILRLKNRERIERLKQARGVRLELPKLQKTRKMHA